MQHTVAEDHIELFALEAGAEQVHLHEPHPIEIVLRAELLAERNELRHRSAPITRRQEMPRKLLNCPVPQPTSSTVLLWGTV